MDDSAFGDGVNRLLGLGLVEDNGRGDVRMHRLVACFEQDALPDKAALVQVEQAVNSATADANNSGYPGQDATDY